MNWHLRWSNTRTYLQILLFISTLALGSLGNSALTQRKSLVPETCDGVLSGTVLISEVLPFILPELKRSQWQEGDFEFRAYSQDPDDLVLQAFLETEKKELNFTIRTRNSQGELIHPKIKAQALFHLMIQVLSQLGEIQTISGEWIIPSENSKLPNEFGTNTDQYMAALRAGRPESEAAESTFTGRMARMYGFRFESVNEQSRGDIQYFSVVFKRP